MSSLQEDVGRETSLETDTPPKKKQKTNQKHRDQKFRDKWLQQKEYKQ